MTDTLLPSSEVIIEEPATAKTASLFDGTPLPVSPAIAATEECSCKTAGPGLWFYDRLEQNTSGPTIYRTLLEQAESKIFIWDPYLTETDAELFSNICAEIDIQILTCCDAKQPGNGYQDFIKAITGIQTKQKFRIAVAAIDKRTVNGKLKVPIGNRTKIPHDRFLFIDERRVFLVGSSLAYHVVETTHFNSSDVTTTMIYEISEPEHKNFLLREFKSYWMPGGSKHQYISMLFPSPPPVISDPKGAK